MTITTTVTSYDGSQAVILASIPGVAKLDGGQVQLLTADVQSGPFSLVGPFSGSPDKLTFRGSIQMGKWFRASLTGASTLLDSQSEPSQLLAMPKIICSISSKGKINSKISGVCKFSFNVNRANVTLNVNSGSGWHSLGSGNANGNTFPFSVVGKSTGRLQVKITSSGTPGLYQAFTSNVMAIQIAKK